MGFVPPPPAPRECFKTEEEWYSYNKKELDNYSSQAMSLNGKLKVLLCITIITMFIMVIFKVLQ